VNVLCVAGARPNFVKIAPIVHALARREVTTTLVHTGQHYDQAMSQVFFDELGLRAPDHFLGAGSGTQAEQTSAVMTAFEAVVGEVEPDAVVVVGDVNSTVAAAMVAAKAGALVVHVEAGLRSRDWAMPEEINRVVTDRLSDLLLAPSADAVNNLAAEGYRTDQIHLVGNVMIDTLVANLESARSRRVASRLELADRYGVVTLHRPSNVDHPETLAGIVTALATISNDLPLVFPAHPRTVPLLDGLKEQCDPGQLRVIEPLGYLDFLGLVDGSTLVLTDSGGVQEETTVVGVPCLTLRESTERPITVTQGTNQVVGTDPEHIVEAATRALAIDHRPCQPDGWDGAAAARSVEVILAALSEPDRPRPTDLVPDFHATEDNRTSTPDLEADLHR